MLLHAGYKDYDFLFLSSEKGLTKALGGLFDEAIHLLGVEPQKMLHIGDNYESDIRRARLKGIRAFHLDKLSNAFTETIVGKRFAKKSLYPIRWEKSHLLRKDRSLDFWLTIWRGLSTNRSACRNDDFFFRLGYDHVGMLLLGFCLWLNDEANNLGISNLYFFARDGHILRQAYERLGRHGIVDGFNAQYLFASRRAMNLPAITQVDERSCDFLVSGTSCLTVGEFLKRAGMNPESFELEIRSVGFQGAYQRVDSRKDYKLLRALFRILEPKLLTISREERRLLIQYWRQEGVFDSKHCGIVDIGWHGSLQDSFSELLRLEGYEGRVTGFYLGTYPAAKDREARGARHRAYLFQGGEPKDQLNSVKGCVELFEWFFSAPHGSVLGFSKDGSGSMIPILESGSLEVVREENSARVQSGALAFVDDILSGLPSGVKPPDVPPWLSIALIDGLIHHPTIEEAHLLGEIRHAEGFGGVSQARPLISPIPSLWNPLNFCRIPKAYRNSFWRAGYRRKLLAKVLI